MQRLQTRFVMLDATQAVDLGRGIVLPTGCYNGIETRTGLETVSGDVIWTEPEYKIKLTADQLASMDATYTENLISDEIDVTKFVHSGKLAVT
jgi:hypothetical protein